MLTIEERINKLTEAVDKVQEAIKNLNIDNSKQLESQFKKITDGLVAQIAQILTQLEKQATKGDILSSEEGMGHSII